MKQVYAQMHALSVMPLTTKYLVAIVIAFGLRSSTTFMCPVKGNLNNGLFMTCTHQLECSVWSALKPPLSYFPLPRFPNGSVQYDVGTIESLVSDISPPK